MPKITSASTKKSKKNFYVSDDDFRKVLGLSVEKDNDYFQIIKEQLRNLVKDHFSYDRTICNQSQEAWNQVNNKIKQTIPEVLSTEQRRYGTLNYMSKHLNTVRHSPNYRKHRLGTSTEHASGEINLGQDNLDKESSAASEVPIRRRPDRPRRSQPRLAANSDTSPSVASSGDVRADDVIPEGGKEGDITPETGKYDEMEAAIVPIVPRRPGRPRRDIPYVEQPDTSQSSTTELNTTMGNTIKETSASACPPSQHSFATKFPSEPSMFCTVESDQSIREFLRTCKPSLEYLLPVMTRVGLKNLAALEGMLDWGKEQRISWLKGLSDDNLGIDRLEAYALSLAFDVVEQLATTAGDASTKSHGQCHSKAV